MAIGNLETLTLEFDNARAVQALYGGDDKLLRELEAALDVRVTSRDGWLRIEGGEDGVTRARKVFEQLDEARRRGVVIRRPEFNYAVHATGRNGGANLGRLWICESRHLLASLPLCRRPMARRRIFSPCRPAILPLESAPPGRGRHILPWRRPLLPSNRKKSAGSS